jgi:hypothetical protein
VLSIPPDNRQLTLATCRRTPDGSGWGKGFLDNFVGNEESLTNELEPTREPMMLGPFEPGGGRVGFFEHETHFGGWPGSGAWWIGRRGILRRLPRRCE